MYATLSAAALVSAYNAVATVADVKQVTRFADRTVGAKRLTDLIAKLTDAGKVVAVAEDGAVTVADLEVATDVTSGEGASDSAPVADPVDAPVEGPAPTTVELATDVPVKSDEKAAPVAAKAKGGSKSPSVRDGDVIYVKVQGNPKKAEAATRFGYYRDGLTVEGYIKAVGDRRQALRDLAWDVRKGWVEVVGAALARKREAAKAKAAEVASAETSPTEEVAKAA